MSSLEKVKDFVIFKDENYNTFPNAIRRKDGTIIVGFRQAPDWQRQRISGANKNFGKVTHVDPASRAVYVTSKDDGVTWDKKVNVLYDDFVYGVQDPCLNSLSDGTLFCSFFMWKVFKKEDMKEILPSDRIINGKWIGRRDRAYSIRSFDGGVSWDEPIPIEYPGYIPIAVRGNAVEINDGAILLPVYGNGDVIILKTYDLGRHWEKAATINALPEYSFAEPNLYKTESGKLVTFIRSHKRSDKSVYDPENVQASPLITSESFDNGNTWSRPVMRKFYSPSPFHALRLKSGNVIVTYGYRYKPFGLRAFILNSECSNFEQVEDVILRDDGFGTDIGYTSSILLINGDVLITYYYFDEEDGSRYIAGTICREIQD